MSVFQEIKKLLQHDYVEKDLSDILSKPCCNEAENAGLCKTHLRNETFLTEFQEKLKNPKNVNYLKLFADLCKFEDLRIFLLDENIVKQLLSNLLTTDVNQDFQEQTCRAIGNLCYEFEDAQKLVLTHEGLKILIDYIMKLPDYGNDNHWKYVYSIGALINLSSYVQTDDHFLNTVKTSGMLIKCVNLLKKEYETESCSKLTMFIILFMSNIVQKIPHDVFTEEFLNIYVDLLQKNENLPLLFDLLSIEKVDDDSIRMKLLKSGFIKVAMGVITKSERHHDCEEHVQIKLAAESMIFWILESEDAVMKILDEDNEHLIIEEIIKWLACNNEFLNTTAAKLVNLMAHLNTNADIFIRFNTHINLINCFKNCLNDKNMKYTRDALLIAIGKLIKKESKSAYQLVRDGVFEEILQFAKTFKEPQDETCIKLLFVFRKFASCSFPTVVNTLGNDLDFLKTLLLWISKDEDEYITSDAFRLFTCILFHAKDPDNRKIANNFLEVGLFKVLPKFASFGTYLFNRAMQNDVIVLLCLSCGLLNDRFHKEFIENDYVNSIKLLVHTQAAEKSFPLLWNNLFKLIMILLKSSAVKETIIHCKLYESLEDNLKIRDDFELNFKNDLRRLDEYLFFFT